MLKQLQTRASGVKWTKRTARRVDDALRIKISFRLPFDLTRRKIIKADEACEFGARGTATLAFRWKQTAVECGGIRPLHLSGNEQLEFSFRHPGSEITPLIRQYDPYPPPHPPPLVSSCS